MNFLLFPFTKWKKKKKEKEKKCEQTKNTTLSQQFQKRISKYVERGKSISLTQKYIIRKPWIDIDKEVYVNIVKISLSLNIHCITYQRRVRLIYSTKWLEILKLEDLCYLDCWNTALWTVNNNQSSNQSINRYLEFKFKELKMNCRKIT